MSRTWARSLLFLTAGDKNKASSRVRSFWITEQLNNSGFRCTVRWQHGRLAMVAHAFAILRHDTVIFQKTYSRYHRWLMQFARMLGKKTYVDIDDAPSRTNSAVTLRNFEAMCRTADGVFAGSSNLVDYTRGFQANSHLVPSSIYLPHYQPVVKRDAASSAAVCLGWVGNGKHYQRDLIEILETPLRELAARHRLRFKLVGACGVKELYEVFEQIPGLQIEFIDAVDWSDPSAVSQAISDFDVGLYPLLPNEFNHYKCGFKALEYMAMSTPVVASPVANNADVVQHGETGLLVHTADEWVASLEELIQDGQRRLIMGQKGRERVEVEFNTVHTADLLAELIQLQPN